MESRGVDQRKICRGRLVAVSEALDAVGPVEIAGSNLIYDLSQCRVCVIYSLSTYRARCADGVKDTESTSGFDAKCAVQT